MEFDYRDYVYDLETYPNIFTICIADTIERRRWVFEISSRKDERELMIAKLREIKKEKGRMVGFNNINFDYPVLHYILRNQKCSVDEIYKHAMEIINKQNFDENRRAGIPKKEWLLPQLDLLKIHHFDNKARMTSLKMLEFNMRSEEIEDLPFPVGKILSSSEMDTLIKYNKKDVYETFLFYEHSLDAIRFREELSVEYGRDFTNHNDTKIGKDYFVQMLEKEDKGCCYKFDHNSKSWKVQQTKRKSINLGEVILPYVKFDRPELNALKDWFSKQVIQETKGVFTDIMEHDLGELAKYCELQTKRAKLKEQPTDEQIDAFKKEWPLCWIEERPLKSGKSSWYRCWRIAETLNVVMDGVTYYCGVGGIHAAVNNSVWESDGITKILSRDVKSFYPNLSIQNNLYPEHLGDTFCKVYSTVYQMRLQFPKDKFPMKNLALKLALNGTYGASNDKFSPFYDPKFTMSITVNGQLSLLMLAENLTKIKGVQIIMANTDGLEYVCPVDKINETDKVCKEWEVLTNLELEGEVYNKLFIRDVNNYLGVFDNGKVKRKASYEYEGLGWHQNQSALIIPMCAEQILLNNVDPYEFMRNHDDIFDFCLRTKVPRSSRLVSVGEDGDETLEQNICRFIATKNGVNLVKIMPPLPDKDTERRIGILTGQTVTICNKLNKSMKFDIDYDYYISEVIKLTDVFNKDC